MRWIRPPVTELLFRSVLALLSFISGTSVLAQAGVNADSIVLGHIAGFSGQVAGAVKEQNAAANAYFEWINQQGGVHGRKIVLKTADDKFDPATTGLLTKRWIESREDPFAFFVPRGTPHLEAMLKHAQPAGIPIIGPQSGAAAFHTPVNPLVFNVKARYQDEVIAGVRHFATVAINKIALLHVNDSFGNDARMGFERGMAEWNLKPVAILHFDRVKQDVVSAVPDMMAAKPDAIIVVGSAAAVPTFIKEMRKRGSTAQFLTLSNNSSVGFLKNLGEHRHGVLVTQVTLPADNNASPLGREFRKVATPLGVPETYSAMEAFVAAKVMVEGLKRTGRDLTRERFLKAMESLKRFDLGGMEVDYSPVDHTGSTFVEITMIRPDGRFLR